MGGGYKTMCMIPSSFYEFKKTKRTSCAKPLLLPSKEADMDAILPAYSFNAEFLT